MIEILYDNSYLNIRTCYNVYGIKINKYIFYYFTIRSSENKAIVPIIPLSYITMKYSLTLKYKHL